MTQRQSLERLCEEWKSDDDSPDPIGNGVRMAARGDSKGLLAETISNMAFALNASRLVCDDNMLLLLRNLADAVSHECDRILNSGG